MDPEDITINTLRQLIHVQTELRDLAENRWQKAQRASVELLEAFAPEEVELRLKAGRTVDSLAVDELGQLIRQSIGGRLDQAQVLLREYQSTRAPQELQEQLSKCQSDLKEAQGKILHLTDRNNQLESANSGLLSQLAALQQSVPMNKEPIVKANSGENPPLDRGAFAPPEPGWMIVWRQTETFERDASILKMMGETGLARRPLIEAQAAEILGIKKAGGSIQALLARLVGLNLVEIYRPWHAVGSGTGGRYPDLIRLTEQGKLGFWLLTLNQPKLNEYDLLLERHVSPEHTLLNLQAADFLREAGYQVNLTPNEIHLPDKGTFRPDLVLTDVNGKINFVEVERDTHKNIEGRQSKWRNFYQASGGHLYVVCDNFSCMRNIRSEINYCLGSKPIVIYLTNIADLLAGKRGDNDSIWLDKKEKVDTGNH